MAKGGRYSKYSRRTVLTERRSRAATIAVAIVAFILLCVVISVVIGILLGDKADEYNDRKTPFEIAGEDHYSGDKLVKSVDAYAYEFGADVKGYIGSGITDLSVCLRSSDGKLSYSSAVASLMGSAPDESKKPLEEYVEYIHNSGGRVCAYFHVSSFNESDKYLRELYKDYEIALVNEAARSGVHDILLVGLAVAQTSVDEIEAYVSRMSYAAEGATLGVLMPESAIMLQDDGEYLAARIRSVCDYIALDLRSLDEGAGIVAEGEENSALEELLTKNQYYIEAYRMRIVLSKENSSLYDDVKGLGVKNIQIIGN